MRVNRRPTSVDRILGKDEWSWITGSLVFLRREHPRFLAAASSYRNGLLDNDPVDRFCCFWRVIERLALSYANRSSWSQEDKEKSAPRKCVCQLITDLFDEEPPPSVLADPEPLRAIVQLRNDLSHGNIPITVEVVETAHGYSRPLESAAFSVLHRVKNKYLVDDRLT